MKNIYVLIIAVLLIVSCNSDSSVEDISNVDLKFIQFDVVLLSGEKSVGIIDNEDRNISLPGVIDPLEIKSVTYKTSEDVSLIIPTPDSRIGSWGAEVFRLRSGSNSESYTVSIPDYKEPTYRNLATISPLETFGTPIKYYMLDHNGDPNKVSKVSTANVAFNEKRMNGIRFPLYCGDYYGGHPS